MDDGRPAPAPVSQVVEAKPTTAKVVAIVGGVVAVAAAAVGVLLWNSGGSGLSSVLPRALGVVLFLPLVALLFTMATSGSVTLTERLTGWANPTVEFTPWPPQIGRTMTAVYRRRAISARARNRMQTAVQIETELVCEEWVEYTVGTDTRTDTHKVVSLRSSAPAQPTGDGVEARLTVAIPASAGAPTIDLDHNKVRWHLDSRLGAPFGKRTATRIGLIVEPVLDLGGLIEEGPYGGSGAPGVDR